MASEHEVLEQDFTAAVEQMQTALAKLMTQGTGRSGARGAAGERAKRLFAVAAWAEEVARRARFVADSILDPLFREV